MMRKEQGFTLIEVLIAIVIFSIGLLGIAGLQVAGMRFTHDSRLRSLAVAQAETMADMMRANDYGVDKGYYNMFKKSMPTSSAKDCSKVACEAEERANYDLYIWNNKDASPQKNSNPEMLQDGDGIVCLDSTPIDGKTGAWACDGLGNVYAIKVQWTERSVGKNDVSGTDADQRTQLFVMSVLPALGDTIDKK